MKILIVSNMYPSKAKAYSGIFVKNQYEYIKEFLGPEHTVDIFYMKRTFTSPLGSILKYLMTFIKFFSRPIFSRYDIIHVHYFYPLYALAYFYKLMHPKARIVVTFHGRDITEQVKGGVNQRIFAFLAKKIDIAIAVGKTLDTDHIQKKLRRKADVVLAAGVDDRVFFIESGVIKIYDFIYVGSFIHRKGTDILIGAIKEVSRQFPETKFCVAGSGAYLSELKVLSEKCHLDIYIDQKQEQLRSLYNKSRFNLLPSRNEGFPLSVVEGFFCGIPIVGSDIPQLKEQVSEGHNGFVTDCTIPGNFSTKMIECLNLTDSEYQQMSTNAQNSFKEVALSNVCKHIITIYRSLV